VKQDIDELKRLAEENFFVKLGPGPAFPEENNKPVVLVLVADLNKRGKLPHELKHLLR